MCPPARMVAVKTAEEKVAEQQPQIQVFAYRVPEGANVDRFMEKVVWRAHAEDLLKHLKDEAPPANAKATRCGQMVMRPQGDNKDESHFTWYLKPEDRPKICLLGLQDVWEIKEGELIKMEFLKLLGLLESLRVQLKGEYLYCDGNNVGADVYVG